MVAASTLAASAIVTVLQTVRCPLWVISRHSRRKKSCPPSPKSGHERCNQGCPLRANSGHRVTHCVTHSITSSARSSSVVGTLRPSALAVLRLITSTYLFGACTGRSAGFSPLRMRST